MFVCCLICDTLMGPDWLAVNMCASGPTQISMCLRTPLVRTSSRGFSLRATLLLAKIRVVQHSKQRTVRTEPE